MNILLKASVIFAATATVTVAMPAAAAVSYTGPSSASSTTFVAPGAETFEARRDWQRDRRFSRNDQRRGYGNSYRYNDRNWRGNNRRYSCDRGSGTTGLVVGGAAGALIGRELDNGRDRTLGTILGAGAGALLGRGVERGGSRC